MRSRNESIDCTLDRKLFTMAVVSGVPSLRQNCPLPMLKKSESPRDAVTLKPFDVWKARFVPAPVPSLTNQTPNCGESVAVKKTRRLVAISWEGNDDGAGSGTMFFTRRVPSAVASVDHSSLPSQPPAAPK